MAGAEESPSEPPLPSHMDGRPLPDGVRRIATIDIYGGFPLVRLLDTAKKAVEAQVTKPDLGTTGSPDVLPDTQTLQ